MMLNMAKNQEGRDIASTGEKNQINCAILMKSLNGWERQYFYGAAGALSLIKNVPSPWKAFRSIFDLDHKSRRLCLWVHMHSGGELWVHMHSGGELWVHMHRGESSENVPDGFAHFSPV